ncbi:MAG: capsule assembly Wzi family protein [Melioribacteraceae bacterium]|nr:capsule assembly Wzi family protein [Melioribacteraceae bacterium]
MKILKLIFPLYLFIAGNFLFAQQENVNLDNEVYSFLKEMKVKFLIDGIHDDNPNMSRFEVLNFLKEIKKNENELSLTEKKLLEKFLIEFDDDNYDENNTVNFFGGDYSKSVLDFFSDKNKYAFIYRDSISNFYLNVLGRFLYGQSFEPIKNNSELYDIGFRFRGTLIDRLGYSLSVQKGGVSGSQALAPTFEPRLKYNFKFIEAIENIGNYDFAEGYVRYFIQPKKNMNFSFQLGREKITFGYGYDSKLVISGNHTYLDFFKINFDYGIFNFTSMTASTVGNYNDNRDLNYTKLIALNRFKVNIPKLIEFGLGENIIYSGRGIDLAYFNPMIFYKFVEMSLQDRDNGSLWLDFQTNFIKNFEISGTFFLDENILSHLQEMNLYSNKTAYQIGAFWYSPFSISDLSLVFEYTKIRPYVYSHSNGKNSYTAFGEILGHRIGPNADEILWRVDYNLNSKTRISLKYQYIRSGENIYDNGGRLLFNSGGDAFVPFRNDIDSKYIDFLDGERINQNIFTANFRYELWRKFYLDFTFKALYQKNITRNKTNDTIFAMFKFWFEV